MVADAASKAQRRCDDDGASDEDAHVNSPVLIVASGDDYIDSSRESCDTFDTQRTKRAPAAVPPYLISRAALGLGTAGGIRTTDLLIHSQAL